MKSLISLFAVLVFVDATVHAQEKTAIKLKEVAAGETWRVEMKESATSKATTNIEKEKQPKVQDGKMSKHLAFTETILEKPAGANMPSKAKRVYEAANSKISDAQGSKETTLAYQGKTLLIEKKDKGYEFRIENGPVLDKDNPELVVEFVGEGPSKPKKIFVPPNPVAVNETWKIEPKEIFGDFAKDPNTKILKSEGTSKLVKVYKKDGRLYGTIESLVAIEFKITLPGPGDGNTVQMKINAKMDFDGCIDGTFAAGKMTGRVDMQSTAAAKLPDVGAVNTISQNSSTIEQTWQELPKK